MSRRPPRGGRLAAVAIFALLFLGIEAAVRLALFARAWPHLEPTPGLLARTLGAGFLYDAVAASWAALPAAVALALVPRRLLASLPGRALAHGVFIAALFVLLFSAAAEWLFWSEFGARFNFIAVDYLVYTREVVGNVIESYPVGTVAPALLATAILLWLPWRAALSASFGAPTPFGRRLAGAAAVAGVAALSFFALDGRLTHVSDNRYAREVAANGLYQLFSAFRNNALDYEPFYLSEGEDAALRRVRRLVAEPGARFTSTTPGDLSQEVAPAGAERRWNVMLVVVESLSADYVGALGGREDLTPELDAVIPSSLRFSRLYATGTRTVRGLEAIALSVPPTPGSSIVKRPGNTGLYTIGTPFLERGYDVRFLYGGYGFFDNMNAFFGGNGFRVVDRGSLASDEIQFANVWGVSDEDLFRRALRESDDSYAAGRPFFSLLMTTSNHRPYTYPEGRIDIPSQTGRAGGVRYSDWALGQLLREARGRPWFDQTLFVIVADHCASSSGRTDVPVRRYRIPLLVYAPGLVAPREVDTLASQMDLAPTLFGLLGFRYTARFFGRDVLRMAPEEGRALLGTYQDLGLLQGRSLTVLSPGRRSEAFRVDLARGAQEPTPVSRGPLRNAIAYYQSASYAWRHGLLRVPGPSIAGL